MHNPTLEAQKVISPWNLKLMQINRNSVLKYIQISLSEKWNQEGRCTPSTAAWIQDSLIQRDQDNETTNEAQNTPLPRSSGSACTTTARPIIEFTPVKGICATITFNRLRISHSEYAHHLQSPSTSTITNYSQWDSKSYSVFSCSLMSIKSNPLSTHGATKLQLIRTDAKETFAECKCIKGI
jgi:hypothetical protein